MPRDAKHNRPDETASPTAPFTSAEELTSDPPPDDSSEAPTSPEIPAQPSDHHPGWLEGRTLAHYSIAGPLGAGGMGEVYLARDLALGRTVAFKVMRSGLTWSPRARHALERCGVAPPEAPEPTEGAAREAPRVAETAAGDRAREVQVARSLDEHSAALLAPGHGADLAPGAAQQPSQRSARARLRG